MKRLEYLRYEREQESGETVMGGYNSTVKTWYNEILTKTNEIFSEFTTKNSNEMISWVKREYLS